MANDTTNIKQYSPALTDPQSVILEQFLNHVNNKRNPHLLTLEQLGLTEEDLISPPSTYRDVGFNVYTCLMNQSYTDDPIPYIFENTIGEITWFRIGTGSFLGTSIGTFSNFTFLSYPGGKDNVWYPLCNDNGNAIYGYFKIYRDSIDSIGILTVDSSFSPMDSLLINLPLEIRIYDLTINIYESINVSEYIQIYDLSIDSYDNISVSESIQSSV